MRLLRGLYVELGRGFHETKQGVRYTLSEAARREVLSRLLKLNHERRSVVSGEEAGLASGKRDLFDGQLSLGEALE